MKLYRGILFNSLLIFILLFFTRCENSLDTSPKPGKFTWVAEKIDDYIDKNKNAKKIPLKVNLDSESDWENLLATLSYKYKYVELDISDSAWPGLETFDPGRFKTGKLYIVSIILPKISTSIIEGTEEYPAFKHFAYLKEISGGNIEKLGDYSLYGVHSLQTVDFPALNAIGKYAFAGTVLNRITIPNGVTGISAGAFFNCEMLASVTIPDTVTTIGERAFYGCAKLDGITIPNGITTIETGAFGKSGLSRITIPTTVTAIKTGAFADCVKLSGIDIPDTVTSIGQRAFAFCHELKSITVPNGITTIESEVFYNSGLSGIDIPDTVTTIKAGAFAGCFELSSINIPDTVTSIGERAFTFCLGLNSIIIPNGITCIESDVFYNSGLSGIDIPDTVTSIKAGAFRGSALSSITIPDSVTSIGEKAFSTCSELISVSFSDNSGITAIENYVFEYCNWLSSITIPDAVTAIGDYAFMGCAFTEVIIPDNVTKIGIGAFSDCRLNSVTIPDSVTSIGETAFDGCRYLAGVTFDGDEVEFPASAFPGDLRDQYSEEGAGTYIKKNSGNNAEWEKQE